MFFIFVLDWTQALHQMQSIINPILFLWCYFHFKYRKWLRIYHYIVTVPTNCSSLALLIYDLQSEDWINKYYILKGFLKAHMPPKVSNEMKCTNEKMTWNTKDMNLSSYVPKANVDHTIRISTLGHSVTIPRAHCINFASIQLYYNHT